MYQAPVDDMKFVLRHLVGLDRVAALDGDGVASGFVGDLVKAFERIPREPLLYALRHFGLEPSFVDAWARFLDGVERMPLLAGNPSLVDNTPCLRA